VAEEIGEEVWESLDAERDRLQALRGAAAERCAATDQALALDFIHATNALDGNTLTRAETEAVLSTGIAVGGRPLLDHMEALDQSVAFDLLTRLADTDQPLRDSDIRQLHAAALARTRPDTAGRYREGERSLEGSLTTFPDPLEIEGLIGELIAWLAAQPADARTAIEAHERFVSIQPFEDGNGRTSRLLMNLVLVRGGYPVLVVEAGDRAAYHTALEALQLGGPRAPYERYMTDRLAASFRRYG